MTWLWYLLLALVCAAMLSAAWRFFTLRSRGCPVVIRSLPNPDGRHWRHGVLIYSDRSARLYKLRSLRLDSDVVLTRLGLSIDGRRQMTAREAHVLEPDLHIVQLDHRGKKWEMAVDSSGDTALVAWLESAPSARRDSNSAYNHPRPM